MTPTPVGMRCPECSRERTKVRTIRSPSTAGYSAWQILIAINVIVFVAELATGVTGGGSDSGWVYEHGALFGPLMSHGYHQYWRLLTSGFLHASLIHIGVNMLSLYFVGRALEPAIGKLHFTGIYFASLLAGSFGALLFQPQSPTLGASTAIFGVFGALIVVAHRRGISIWQSGLGLSLVLNLFITLGIAGVSIGGHLGGLASGLICGWFYVEYHERRGKQNIALLAYAAVAVVSVIAGIAVAGGTGLLPNGLGFSI
jgi:membrane associated rhomboid family serine protease